jgi:hypothetical protein
MRRLVEPAIEYVKPLLGKLRGLKGSIEKKLMNVLGPKGAKILKELGGKGSEGLMKKIGSKAIPIVGGIANLYFGYEALKNGDPIGALLEFTSGAFDLIGLVPGGQWGPMVSMGLDVYNFIRGMVPGITDAENNLVKSLGLEPIMNTVKEFGSKLPGAETGRGPGFDAYDPRMKSGNFLVGALTELLNIMPGGEILKNEFGPQLFAAKRAFGAGVVSLSETPMMAPVISAKNQVKEHLNKFFQATVQPIKDALGEILKGWLSNLPSAVTDLARGVAPGLTNLVGLGDAESVKRSTGAPTLDSSRNYGIKENDKFFFDDDKGQKFHAVNTGSGLQFYEGGVAGVGGRLRHTTNEDGSAANTGMVQAFLKAKEEGARAPGAVNNAGPLGNVGSPGEIYLHWSAGNKATTRYPGKYHTAITGDGKIHRDSPYSNRGRAHTAYRNSRGIGIAVSAMAGPSGNYDWANPIQYEAMAQEVADLAKAWGWSKSDITVKNVMTHAEAASGKDGRLNLHQPPHPDASTNPDNHGPTAWGGDGARWDLWHLQKDDPKGSGGPKIREMIKQRMNKGGLVRKVGDGEDELHKKIAGGEERKNLGGLVKIAETRGARVMGQSSGINRESILHPGITRAPVEIGAVQRIIMPIPTPMSAESGAGGGSAPPSPLSTFGR